MDSSYDIVPYQPEFKQQVLELQTLLWSPSLELNRAYFEWKYERNPYIRSPLLYLALDGGKVVGTRSFFGVRWQAGPSSQVLNGLYADDMVVAREHRRRGLTHLIMEQAFKDLARLGHEYVFNLSAGSVTFAVSLSMGWQSAGSMQPMRWRSWRFAASRKMRRGAAHIPGLGRHSGKFLSTLVRESTKPMAGADRSQAVNRLLDVPSISFAIEPRIDAMSALVDRTGKDSRIRHVRDCSYLGWRFQNPLSRYGFLFCDQEGLEGYLVLQEYTSEFADRTVLNILDWEGTSAPVLNRLLQAARQVAGHSKVLKIWSATLSEERSALLAQNGFEPTDKKPGAQSHQTSLLVRAIAPDLPASQWQFAGRQLVDMADWDVRMLYSMCG